MKLLKLVTYTILVLCLFACGSASNTTKKTSVKNAKPKEEFTFTQKAGNIYFTVLQLNDVYEIAPIQGGKFGGMARVETIHKQLLKETPNTMIVLAGDFLNPSLLGSMKYEGERIKGKQMVEVMNAMNFDLVAFGNHEFDISYTQLQDRLNESNFDWMSANVLHNKNGKAHYFHKVKNGKKKPVFDSYIKEFSNGKENIKVGFVGVCIPSNPRSYVTYSDMFIEAERSYNEIKNKTNIILGLTHLDIEQDRKVAKMLPKIPLIMGGHEHKNNYETIGNVKIAKADANAKTVYIHRFEYNPITKGLKMKSELKTIDETIPEDPKVAVVVNKWQQILNAKIKEVVAKPNEVVFSTKIPLEARDTPTRSTQTNMGELINKAMINAYKNSEIDCSFLNGGSIRIDDVLEGDINAVDVFRVLPFGGQIYKVKIKGKLLKEVLEYGLKAIDDGAFLQRYNCNKVNGVWQVKNQPIQNEKIYTITTSDFLLKGFDIPFLKEGVAGVISIYKPTSNEVAFDVRKAVIQYLKTKK